MMFLRTTLALAICSCVGTASANDMANYHAAPTGKAIKGNYIVVYKTNDIQLLNSKASRKAFTASITNQIENQIGVEAKLKYSNTINGALIEADPKQLKALLTHPNVDYIEQDSVMSIDPIIDIGQANATWGLDRIDQRNLPLDGHFNPSQLGNNVTAYVIDTGVNFSHNEFGGRATSGRDFIDNDNDANDCNGHGTHVAGTIAGSTYGVAKNANIVGVRVLGCNGSGSTSGVIGGVDWVADHASGSSVANMSLGGGQSTALNSAVASAVDSGIAFVVAAGNNNSDACTKSPASEPKAITVGSTTSNDSRSSFSNYGNCLDIFGPGSSIKSAWIGSNSATKTISGTSMASPHVAGVAALYLDKNAGLSPTQLADALTSNATKNKVIDAKNGSPNNLVYTESVDEPGDGLEVVLSGDANSESRYTHDVPAGRSQLTVTISGGSGDADLYIKHGITPIPLDFDCAGAVEGNNESCVINNPKSGTWHILVHGYSAFNGVTLKANSN
ncbi:S8 family serine peptidase [uncultured Shewanella sp.]|uniref:S8 family serine peptidase n=1 Tax=uncultured Shewanella sp. TaxID=173975 RepID=UPI002637D14F|nr:S8 family serine peptidase [uncultured Shewanella sp.]